MYSNNNIFFILLIFLLCSCKSEEEKKLEAMDLKLDIQRFDLNLYNACNDSINKNDIHPLFEKHIKSNRDFLLHLNYFGDSTKINDTIMARDIYSWTSNPYSVRVHDSVLKVYPKDFDFQKMFLNPMKRLKLYFPDYKTPEIKTFVTGYPMPGANGMLVLDQNQIFITKNYLGIGLDYFLGVDFDYHFELPQYMRRKCTKDFIIPAFLLKITNAFQPKLNVWENPTILDYIVHQGIKDYFVSRISPETHDTTILSYTKKQLDWCDLYKKNIFNELLPYLYKTDQKAYEKYMLERPFTQGLSQDSPGRIGEWLGYQIVKKYMENFPETDLKKLLQNKDFRKIFKDSGYKP